MKVMHEKENLKILTVCFWHREALIQIVPRLYDVLGLHESMNQG